MQTLTKRQFWILSCLKDSKLSATISFLSRLRRRGKLKKPIASLSKRQRRLVSCLKKKNRRGKLPKLSSWPKPIAKESSELQSRLKREQMPVWRRPTSTNFRRLRLMARRWKCLCIRLLRIWMGMAQPMSLRWANNLHVHLQELAKTLITIT